MLYSALTLTAFIAYIAGWSSPVARQAHNLKVVSSNLAPASKLSQCLQALTVTISIIQSHTKISMEALWKQEATNHNEKLRNRFQPISPKTRLRFVIYRKCHKFIV